MNKFIPTCYREQYAKKSEERQSSPFANGFRGGRPTFEERRQAQKDPLAFKVATIIRNSAPLSDSYASDLVLEIVQRNRSDLAKKLLEPQNFKLVFRYHKARQELSWIAQNSLLAAEPEAETVNKK